MVQLSVLGQARADPLLWKFTTLAGLLGLSRIWNYGLALALLPIGCWALFRARRLPAPSLLSYSLAVSLLCAPYSFAYDLLLLLPALLWLTPRLTWRTLSLWIAAATIPYVADYSSAAGLVTVLVVALGTRQAGVLAKADLATGRP
jgi:hypothetical protein